MGSGNCQQNEPLLSRFRRGCQPYLQSNVAELTTFPQRVHFGHGGVQETFILEDQITVWNHLGEFRGVF